LSTTAQDRKGTIELSIVTTMFRSAPFLAEFHKRASEAAACVASSYEIVFVNDGSPDDALSKARALVETDPHVRVIDLSRNFGHHRAIMVGLEHSRGHRVFLIDCDLEEDPLALPGFVSEIERTQADVVYGVQASRRGGMIRRVGGAIFWRLFNAISEVHVTPNVLTSRLMTRRYIDALLGFRERELFLAGIFGLAGFLQVPLTVDKEARADSSYTVRKRFSLFVNAITSFSNKPLIYVFYLGMAISLVGCIAAATLVYRVIFDGGFLTGWASLIVSIWLLGGAIVFCLGLVGIYLAKIFQEVKDRPLSIVRATYEQTADGS
jgi:putative glycosyltransferase